MIKDVKIVYTEEYDPSWPKMSYAHSGDAGFDLRSTIQGVAEILPGQRLLISTGIKVAIPEGYELQIRPRSGLACKKGITVINSPGTLDTSYRGIVIVCLVNLSQEPYYISYGDRIAQAVLSEFTTANFIEVSDLDETERGENGFGSSGVK